MCSFSWIYPIIATISRFNNLYLRKADLETVLSIIGASLDDPNEDPILQKQKAKQGSDQAFTDLLVNGE